MMQKTNLHDEEKKKVQAYIDQEIFNIFSYLKYYILSKNILMGYIYTYSCI